MAFDIINAKSFLLFVIGVSLGVLKKEDSISNFIFLTLGSFAAFVIFLKVLPILFEDYESEIMGLETLVDALEAVKIG